MSSSGCQDLLSKRISYLPKWLSLSGNAPFHGGASTDPIELYGDDGCVFGPEKVQGMKVLVWLSQSGMGGFSEFGTSLHPKGNKGEVFTFISSVIHDGT
jgi:hypothetical protein